MDTDCIEVFVATSQAGSLSAAARRLGITPMLATRRLAALEEDLGVRLMNRTTRSVALTAEGEAFLPFALAVLENAAAGRATVGGSRQDASGLLRVTTSAAFGRQVLAPMLPALLRENPDLRIDIDMTDTVVDIVASGVDVAIRISRLRDNSLVAKRLAPNPRLLCASPSYLAAHATPRKLVDLAGQDCITLSGLPHWIFNVGGKEKRVRVPSRLSCTSIEGALEASAAGGGICLVSNWNAREAIRTGRLVEVKLEDATPEELSIWAVYPTARLVLPKLRTFLDALESRLKSA
jgi:DNA-binding transcriptional LysR family regulator